MAKKRFPDKHVDTLKRISKEKGPLNRFTLAAALAKELGIRNSTALDYVLGAVAEGYLTKRGFSYVAN
jgi:hypothetical protein